MPNIQIAEVAVLFVLLGWKTESGPQRYGLSGGRLPFRNRKD